MLTFLLVNLFNLIMVVKKVNKIIFECIECDEKEEQESEMFSGRVITTCKKCLDKPENTEGPVYEIDLGGIEDTTFYPKNLTMPKSTVTSLFLMKCDYLIVNLKTRSVDGFSFERTLDDQTKMKVDVKIKNGPLYETLLKWYDDLGSSRLITRHIPEIESQANELYNKVNLKPETESEVKQALMRIRPTSDRELMTSMGLETCYKSGSPESLIHPPSFYKLDDDLYPTTNPLFITYCEQCDKVLGSDYLCIDVGHKRTKMELSKFLNWKVLGYKE